MSRPRGAAPGPSVNIGKMDKRFSTLFLDLPRLSPDKSTSEDSKEPPTKMKKLLRRLFNTPPRRSQNPSEKLAKEKEREKGREREGGGGVKEGEKEKEERADHLWNAVIGLANPKSKPSSEKATAIPKKTVKPHPGPKPVGGNGNQNSTTQQESTSKTIPPPTDLPSYTTKDIFYKGKGKPVVSSSRDSKFSSISSLPSLKTLNLSSSSASASAPSTAPTSATSTSPTQIQATHLILTRPQFNTLQSLLRRLTRRLKQQEHLVNQLANNLLYIFTRKEAQLLTLKRLRKAEQQNMLSTIFRLKEHCGRIFLRKSAFLSHSFAEIAKFRKVLEDVLKVAVEGIPEACSSKQAEEVRFVLERETVEGFVAGVRRDVDVQGGLDGEMRREVGERCREGRWVSNVGEGVMMVRFVGFLEGRGRALEGVYARIGEVMGGVEGLLVEDEGLGSGKGVAC